MSDKLNRLQRRLEEAQRRAGIGTFEFDLTTDTSSWSPVMYELHGVAPGTPLPTSAAEYARLIHPDDVAAMEAAYLRLRGGSPHEELELRVQYGERWRPVRALMHCELDDDGHPVLFSGTMQDVSFEADRRSELILDRERARDETRAKSRFLARVTHELRTPLAGVIGMIDLARGDQEPAALADHLASARASARHLLELIDDLLDASREDTWGINVVEIEFDLGEVLHQALAMVAPRAQRKGLALEVHLDDELAPARLGDPLRLRQVLVNLLYNAVKFTPRGRVSAHIVAGAEPDEVVVIVEDTGVGIAQEQQAAVFEPFVQGGTEERGEGVGLGLAITRELVQALGGTITMQSTLGTGTRFTVSLRLRAADCVSENTRRASSLEPDSGLRYRSGPLAALRILVAEDHPTNAEIAQTVLARLGHRPTWACDGEAAVAAIGAERFDVVLMDLEMPRLDGMAATRRIRAAEHAGGTARLPIIALSAHHGSALAAAAAGMDAYLRKPLDPDALVALLAQVSSGVLRGPIDHDARLSRVGGRAELARSVAATFVAHEPTLVDPIDQAIASGDAIDLHRAAHGLRGALVMVGAMRGGELAATLEQCSIADAPPLRDQLAIEIARAGAELRLVAAPPKP